MFDFESGTWDGWTVDTATFGEAPVSDQEMIEWGDRHPIGMQRHYMAATAKARHERKEDGQMLSDPFLIERDHLTFLLAGPLHPTVRVVLEVEGQPVRRAFGNNAYDLVRRGWDVSALRGREARLIVEDRAARRSMIRVDDFRLSSTPSPAVGSFNIERRQESEIVRAGEFELLFDGYAHAEGQAIYHSRLVYGHDGRWHLFGAIGSEHDEWQLQNVRQLIHVSSDRLVGGTWTSHGIVLEALPQYGEQFINDPEVIFHEGTYYLFYVGSGKGFGGWQEGECHWQEGRFTATEGCAHGPFSVHLATSQDGQSWTRHGIIFTDSPFAAQPAVYRIDDQWVLYYGTAEPAHPMGKHAIAFRTSSNLMDWSRERTIAMRDTSHTTGWPEHPFIGYPIVLRRGESWYLFAGSINNNNLSRYHVLWPFVSDSPFRWQYSFTPPSGRLFVDGGATIVRDLDGQWYVTTGNVMARGVWLAPLYWNDGADENSTSVPVPAPRANR